LMIYLSIIVADTTVVAMVANFYNVGIYLITFYLVNYIFIGFFIGVGKTKIIFYSSLVTMISAVCLSILFILQCDMNVMGVAYSLLIAYGITSVFLIVCTARYFASNNLDCKKLYQLMNLLSYKEYIPFLRLNSDIFIRSVCLLLSFNSFYIFSSSYGSDVLSANAILIEISLFMAMFLDALANVTESMVGQAYVDKNKKYFKEVIVKTFIQCMLITLFFVIVYVIFKNQIVDLFTSIEPVKIEIDKYILFSMLLPVVASVSFWIDGVFIGMLKTIAMRNAMILSSIVYVGFVYVLFGLGNYGLWIALIIFYVARVIFLGFPLKRYLKI
jgi:multidrug resistance protein, MATE family